MKRLTIIALCLCLSLPVTACVQRGDYGNSAGASSITPPLGETESNNGEYSPQSADNAAESDNSATENEIMASMINVNQSVDAFDMKENDTKYGWTLTEIKPYDTPPEAAFYGFLTFTGEVTLTGTITHVNTIYDGFEFVPDEESKGKILIPNGNPEKDFFLSITNDDDPSIAESISGLAVNESGAYTIVLTQYRLAYVPMMATHNAVVSVIEKK